MRAYYLFAAYAAICAALATNNVTDYDAGVSKRATPQYDMYLFEESDCEDTQSGYMCDAYEAGTCCYVSEDTHAGWLFASAAYTDPGRSTHLDVATIEAWERATVDGETRSCFRQITRDEKCASGQWPMFGGAIVDAGPATPTGKRELARDRRAGMVFYRNGLKRWTVPAKSKEAAEFWKRPKDRRGAYMMMVGKLDILQP